jgi:hypothetical protein
MKDQKAKDQPMTTTVRKDIEYYKEIKSAIE